MIIYAIQPSAQIHMLFVNLLSIWYEARPAKVCFKTRIENNRYQEGETLLSSCYLLSNEFGISFYSTSKCILDRSIISFRVQTI